MPENEKMSMEDGIELIEKDVEYLKGKAGIRGRTLLDSTSIRRIEEEFKKLHAEKPRPYPHYEIGHRLIVDHVISDLHRARTLKMTESEEGLIRQLMGRVYFKPPAREYLERKAAAIKLAGLDPERSKLLFEKYGWALNRFVDLLKGINLKREMFNNPIISLHTNFNTGQYRGFADIVAQMHTNAETVTDSHFK